MNEGGGYWPRWAWPTSASQRNAGPHRPFKYDFVFRHEVTTSFELKALVPRFRDWSNQARLHRSLGYQTPWQQFSADAAILT